MDEEAEVEEEEEVDQAEKAVVEEAEDQREAKRMRFPPVSFLFRQFEFLSTKKTTNFVSSQFVH